MQHKQIVCKDCRSDIGYGYIMSPEYEISCKECGSTDFIKEPCNYDD